MSHVVAGRTREIGLRMALGAQLSDVQKLIVRQGMWLAAIGSIIGLALAITNARLLKTFLYGISASDPITFTFIASCSSPSPSSPAGSPPAAPAASTQWWPCARSELLSGRLSTRVAAAGWIVTWVNRHGSTGFGEKFAQSIVNQWGDKPFEDVMKSTDVLMQRFPNIDGNHLAARGRELRGLYGRVDSRAHR